MRQGAEALAEAVPRPRGTGRGDEESGMASASLREGAGSVETTRTRLPEAAARRAMAAAQVVLPTPPLPPMKWNRGRLGSVPLVLVSAFERRLDAGNLVVLR
jgi:hypothetical protein